jgi:hypothetical protein
MTNRREERYRPAGPGQPIALKTAATTVPAILWDESQSGISVLALRLAALAENKLVVATVEDRSRVGQIRYVTRHDGYWKIGLCWNNFH